MIFFFPAVYEIIDFSKGYEFLDKELQKVVRDAKLGKRIADKLVKVRLKSGEETLIYIHIEVQGQFEKEFPERMFVYHYRIFDRYRKPVVSLAVLGDERRKWRPKHFAYKLAGCEMSFKFPIVKLLDYHRKWHELEKSDNVFSIVVRTHLKSMETRKSPEERLRSKKDLFRALYKAKYGKKDILELFRFIDWLMVLPEELKQQFENFAEKYEEERKMKYVTTFEQRGRKDGINLGVQKSVVEALRARFKRVPGSLKEIIQSVSDESLLSKLLRKAVTAESLEAFEKIAERIRKTEPKKADRSPYPSFESFIG
jgi:hypothetical protein